MENKPASSDEYLATLSDEQRAVLERVRKEIVAAAPDAVDGFSYGMPAFKLSGRWLIWYAAWKRHYSLYPVTPELLGADAAELDGYQTDKGTIRFPANRPLPYHLVRRLVEGRITEVEHELRKG